MENQRIWIFFLIIEGKLNPNFFLLANEFKRQKVELMPVVYQELLDVLKMRQEVHLITCIGSLAERFGYERTVKSSIEKLMNEQKIVLHQFSSFESEKQQDMLKQMNNQFIQMPVKIDDAVSQIMTKIEQWSEHIKGPRKIGAKTSLSI